MTNLKFINRYNEYQMCTILKWCLQLWVCRQSREETNPNFYVKTVSNINILSIMIVLKDKIIFIRDWDSTEVKVSILYCVSLLITFQESRDFWGDSVMIKNWLVTETKPLLTTYTYYLSWPELVISLISVGSGYM